MLRNSYVREQSSWKKSEPLKRNFKGWAEGSRPRTKLVSNWIHRISQQYRWIFANFRELPFFSKNRSPTRELISNLFKSFGGFVKKEWTIIRSRFGEEERQHHPWRARRINENLVRMYVYQCWKKEIREKLYSHLGRMAFEKFWISKWRRRISRMWKNRYCSIYRSIYFARISRLDKEETVRKIIPKYLQVFIDNNIG